MNPILKQRAYPWRAELLSVASTSMNDEIEEIKARYERRNKRGKNQILYPPFSPFQHFSRAEREYWFGNILLRRFMNLENLTILEAGAGAGDNLYFLRRLGIATQNIFAADLLPERCELLKNILPENNIFCGDASVLHLPQVDVIFQSTMFSSILDQEFQNKLADKLWNLLKPRGVFIWYDFVVNNPLNPDVRGVPRRRIKELFAQASDFEFHATTLAPPLGRRVGRLYNWLNFPFLRTHVVAALYKN